MPPTRMRVLILVKAAPVLTSRLDETMCVAGVRLDGEKEWVRLHPVPFRDLDDDSRFAKYQAVSVDVIRPRSDRRPESWTPLRDTIAVQDSLGTGVGWAARRQVVDSLRETPMCDLVARNRAGSGPLGAVPGRRPSDSTAISRHHPTRSCAGRRMAAPG